MVSGVFADGVRENLTVFAFSRYAGSKDHTTSTQGKRGGILEQTRLGKKKQKNPWWLYIVMFLVGVIVAMVAFILLTKKDEQPKQTASSTGSSTVTQRQEGSARNTSQTAVSASAETEETSASSDIGSSTAEAPYAVDIATFTEQDSLRFRPKGDSIGTLNRGKSALIRKVDDLYYFEWSHVYRDAWTNYSGRFVYQVELETVPTEELEVSSYSQVPRTVKVNTRFKLTNLISANDDFAQSWQGQYLYSFYASDGTIFLTVPEDNTGGFSSQMEYQLVKQ